MLPRRRSLGDYELRVDQLLRKLAGVEGRSQADVLQDLALVNDDVLHICVSETDERRHTVPYRSTVKMLRSLEDVFAAAALAALEKRPFFTNRKVEKVTEYISRLQLGHTQHSSFIFTVASPLPALPTGEQPEETMSESFLERTDADGRFERQVTRTLMKALEATKRAAEAAKQKGVLDPFQDAVKDGVSANLCDAIVEVTNLSPSREIELSMSWAASYARPLNVPDRVVFQKDGIQLIEAAGDAFWGMSKDYDTKVEGMIALVSTDGKGGGAEVTINGWVEGRARKIHAIFGGEFLSELLRAYEQHLLIRCEGDLTQENGHYTLSNARYFEITDLPNQ